MRLLVAAAALGSCAGISVGDPPWDATAALEQTLVADEFIRNGLQAGSSIGVAAPAAWTITERAGLAAPPVKFAEGNRGAPGIFHEVKAVSASAIVVDGERRVIVVKSFMGNSDHPNPRDTQKHKQSANSLRREALYLEYLRGQPGIPTLYGAFFDGGALHLVVERCGRETTGDDKQRLYRGYLEMAAAHPLGVARAWIRLFRSFAERGGFLLQDFKPSQFTYATRPDGAPAIWLVDGPKPNASPLADALRARREGWTTRRQCCCENERCGPGSSGPGAPESRGVCGAEGGSRTRRRANCVPITNKTHVYDLGARAWILPRLVEAAKGESHGGRAATLLEDVVRRCTRVEPRDRPTFDDLLALLEDDGGAHT